jgi:hypothetical protein
VILASSEGFATALEIDFGIKKWSEIIETEAATKKPTTKIVLRNFDNVSEMAKKSANIEQKDPNRNIREATRLTTPLSVRNWE